MAFPWKDIWYSLMRAQDSFWFVWVLLSMMNLHFHLKTKPSYIFRFVWVLCRIMNLHFHHKTKSSYIFWFVWVFLSIMKLHFHHKTKPSLASHIDLLRLSWLVWSKKKLFWLNINENYQVDRRVQITLMPLILHKLTIHNKFLLHVVLVSIFLYLYFDCLYSFIFCIDESFLFQIKSHQKKAKLRVDKDWTLQ